MPRPPKLPKTNSDSLVDAYAGQTLPAIEAPAAKALDTIDKDKDPWEGLTERQKNIQRLKLRGVGQITIAKILNISQGLVSKELTKIRDIHRAKGIEIDKAAFLGETTTVYEEVEHRAWEMFMGLPNDSPVRIQALQLVMSAREKQAKLLMDIGLIDKASQKMEHTHKLSAPTLIDKWETEGKVRLAETVLSSQLAALPAPTPPEDAEFEEIEDEEED